jgi:hypothetical protein
MNKYRLNNYLGNTSINKVNKCDKIKQYFKNPLMLSMILEIS